LDKEQNKVSLTDLIKRRKNIVLQESEGINLAIYIINKFQGRTFFLKGLRGKYFGLKSEALLELFQEELDSLLILYRYTTIAKRYTDRKGVSQAIIRLIGKASMRSGYNPLDIALVIKTEMPKK
jgi:hypothetical protein